MNELQEIEAEVEDVLSTTGSIVQLVAKQKPIISAFVKDKIILILFVMRFR